MIVYAWRCEGCNTSMLLTETEHLNSLLSPNHSCALTLTSAMHSESHIRCGGEWKPFAQWSAEASR